MQTWKSDGVARCDLSPALRQLCLLLTSVTPWFCRTRQTRKKRDSFHSSGVVVLVLWLLCSRDSPMTLSWNVIVVCLVGFMSLIIFQTSLLMDKLNCLDPIVPVKQQRPSPAAHHQIVQMVTWHNIFQHTHKPEFTLQARPGSCCGAAAGAVNYLQKNHFYLTPRSPNWVRLFIWRARFYFT